MEEGPSLTHEQEIEAVMSIFGVDHATAQALVARQHGESAGDSVAVDSHGKETPAVRTSRENGPAA